MSTIAVYDVVSDQSCASTRAVAGRPRRGIFRRIADAIVLSNQRRAERDIARLLGQSSGRLTDEVERRIAEQLVGNHSFRL